MPLLMKRDACFEHAIEWCRAVLPFCAYFVSRWDADYEAVRLEQMPHRVLTRPTKVLEYFFDGERKARGRWV